MSVRKGAGSHELQGTDGQGVLLCVLLVGIRSRRRKLNDGRRWANQRKKATEDAHALYDSVIDSGFSDERS